MTLAFAVTDFKLQGKTKNLLTLSIAPRPFPPWLDLKGFYVTVSRARKRSGLRVLHKPPVKAGGLDHLYDLQHTTELTVWNKGYDARGDWNRAQAIAAATARAKRPNPNAGRFITLWLQRRRDSVETGQAHQNLPVRNPLRKLQ